MLQINNLTKQRNILEASQVEWADFIATNIFLGSSPSCWTSLVWDSADENQCVAF